MEAFPFAQENQVVAFSSISSAAGLSAIGDFIFRAGLTVDRMVPVGVATTREKLGYQRVAVLYDRIDLYSQSGYEALTEAFADNGVEVVATETFETGDTDFSAQLTRIQALDPDAVFVSALSLERTLILQGRDLGVPFIFLGMTIDEVQAAGASRRRRHHVYGVDPHGHDTREPGFCPKVWGDIRGKTRTLGRRSRMPRCMFWQKRSRRENRRMRTRSGRRWPTSGISTRFWDHSLSMPTGTRSTTR